MPPPLSTLRDHWLAEIHALEAQRKTVPPDSPAAVKLTKAIQRLAALYYATSAPRPPKSE